MQIEKIISGVFSNNYVLFRLYPCLGCFNDVSDPFQVPFSKSLKNEKPLENRT